MSVIVCHLFMATIHLSDRFRQLKKKAIRDDISPISASSTLPDIYDQLFFANQLTQCLQSFQRKLCIWKQKAGNYHLYSMQRCCYLDPILSNNLSSVVIYIPWMHRVPATATHYPRWYRLLFVDPAAKRRELREQPCHCWARVWLRDSVWPCASCIDLHSMQVIHCCVYVRCQTMLFDAVLLKTYVRRNKVRL